MLQRYLRAATASVVDSVQTTLFVALVSTIILFWITRQKLDIFLRVHKLLLYHCSLVEFALFLPLFTTTLRLHRFSQKDSRGYKINRSNVTLSSRFSLSDWTSNLSMTLVTDTPHRLVRVNGAARRCDRQQVLWREPTPIILPPPPPGLLSSPVVIHGAFIFHLPPPLSTAGRSPAGFSCPCNRPVNLCQLMAWSTTNCNRSLFFGFITRKVSRITY